MHDIRILKDEFRRVFGAEAELVSFAPGRVNLIGEHTDYNGGHVFPCALELGISCAVKKRADSVFRFCSLDFPHIGIIEVPLKRLEPKRTVLWSAYVEGVVYCLRQKGLALDSGADMLFFGNLPSGMGLSSSAALEVAAAAALNALFSLGLTPLETALIGKEAENRCVGVNCGIMDQFASAMGKESHAVFLNSATLEYRYAPLALENEALIIVDSRVKHSLAGSAYNDRRKECENALAALQSRLNISALCALSPEEFEDNAQLIADPIERKRAKHAVYENARTVSALHALVNEQLDEFGRLMNASHASLRDDYEVSCPELDVLTSIAWGLDGVIGARMTGGGFGGCMIAIVKNDCVEGFVRKVSEGYLEKTGISAGFMSARAGSGARVLMR